MCSCGIIVCCVSVCVVSVCVCVHGVAWCIVVSCDVRRVVSCLVCCVIVVCVLFRGVACGHVSCHVFCAMRVVMGWQYVNLLWFVC